MKIPLSMVLVDNSRFLNQVAEDVPSHWSSLAEKIRQINTKNTNNPCDCCFFTLRNEEQAQEKPNSAVIFLPPFV